MESGVIPQQWWLVLAEWQLQGRVAFEVKEGVLGYCGQRGILLWNWQWWL